MCQILVMRAFSGEISGNFQNKRPNVVSNSTIHPFFAENYRMRTFRCFLFICAALLPVTLQAQIEDAKAIFRELRALEGTWFMPTDRGDRLEIWSRADDSTLVGKNVRIKPENGDTVTLEILRLERRGNTITYIAVARGQNKNEPVRFELTTADYDGYVFENPQHDDPQKIRYNLLGNRELQVFTEGKKGSRTVTNEFVFEREFAPGAVEFRLRGGVNAHSLAGTGYFPSLTPEDKPAFGWRPGWELGVGARFKGRGGFIAVNVEVGLFGRFSAAQSAFAVIDTGYTLYRRDVTYNTTWISLVVAPEITLKRDGRLSLIAGPYVGRLISSRHNGVFEPQENKNFKSNNDFKKTELGLVAGLQYKLKAGKKRDLGSIIGLRGNLGLSDIDNLYTRFTNNAALGNGRVAFRGVSLYYSFNLLNL